MKITVDVPDALVEAIKDAAEHILDRAITVTELEQLIAEDIAVIYEQSYLANYRGGGYNVDYDYISSCLDDIVGK